MIRNTDDRWRPQADLALAIDRSMESAEEKRARALSVVRFKAALVVQKHKAVLTEQHKSKEHAAAKLAQSLEKAERNRTAILEARISAAARCSSARASAVKASRDVSHAETRSLLSHICSKQAAAEYLRALSRQMRQQRAAEANDHVAEVSQRRRLSDAIAPLIAAARIRSDLFMAAQQRDAVLEHVSNKAAAFVNRAVRGAAIAEIRAEESAAYAMVHLEARMSAASERRAMNLVHSVSVVTPRKLQFNTHAPVAFSSSPAPSAIKARNSAPATV